mgnify:CR=1 FL=1
MRRNTNPKFDYKIKTVDELVHSYIMSPQCNTDDYRLAIDHIIGMNSNKLIEILRSKDNRPSKFDLTIIATANSFKQSPSNLMFGYVPVILEIYKNRKG